MSVWIRSFSLSLNIRGTHNARIVELHSEYRRYLGLSPSYNYNRTSLQFKGGYYCEFCNVLMPIASKVNVHINEDEHKNNKGILLLKSMGLDVVAFENVLIEEKAWHGLIEGVCSLCNAEFEDENEHKADAGHSLNLVLKPIQFGVDNAILRHLDDTAVQCLTCNKLLAPGRMSKHFDDKGHLELYAKRRIETNGAHQGKEAKENLQEKASNMNSVTENYDELKKPNVDNDVNKKNMREDKNNNQKSPTKDKSMILEAIAKYQTKGININLETELAFCKKCSEVVTFDFMEIENHIENHSSVTAVDSDLIYPSNVDQNLNRVNINDKTTQSSNGQYNDKVVNGTLRALRENVQNDSLNEEDKDNPSSSLDDCILQTENFEKYSQEEEASDFAKVNKITYNVNNKQSFCRICEVHLPAFLKAMKEHVQGTNHKRRVISSMIRTKSPDELVKQSSSEFVNSAYDVEGPSYTGNIINEEYCILRNSFHLILENSSRVRCIVCEVNLPSYSNVADHCKTTRHSMKWLGVPVIVSERNEFIREVRPELYHCGFCHLVVSGWIDMKRHLECSEHRIHRTVWENRLRCHMPGLIQYKMREQLGAMAMMRFLNNMFH